MKILYVIYQSTLIINSMKKYLFFISTLVLLQANAQIGIGTESPNATLEIDVDPSTISETMTSPPGFIAPRLSGDVLKSLEGAYKNPQIGAIVYVNAVPTLPTTPKTVDVTSKGFYYFNGTKWIKLGSEGGNGGETMADTWFYAPPIVLPTTSDSDLLSGNYTYTETEGVGVYKINLYDIYNSQFTNAVKPDNAPVLVPDNQNDLGFYITYYDKNVFENVNISDLGLLSYTIKPTDPPTPPVTNPVNGIVTEKTFMNIIFKKK